MVVVHNASIFEANISVRATSVDKQVGRVSCHKFRPGPICTSQHDIRCL